MFEKELLWLWREHQLDRDILEACRSNTNGLDEGDRF